MRFSDRAVGFALLLVTALGWGSNWPLLKLILGEMPPLAARGWAGMLAAAALVLAARVAGVSLAVPRGMGGRLVLYSLLNVTAWMGLTTIAMVWLLATEGAIAAYTMPIWAALLAWLVLGERMGPARAAGLVLGLSGLVILMVGRGLDLGLEKLPALSLVVLAAVLFALGAVLAKRAPLPMHPLASVAWQMGLGCGPLALLALLFERVEWAALSPVAWFCLVWMGLVPLALAYVTWFGALKRLPAGTAAIGTLLAPLVGVAGAGLILGEPFGWREGAALAATLGGVVLASRQTDKPRA
jgi:drug/metabolite transporter (DMT)-like permease